jgi:hypothetical protein
MASEEFAVIGNDSAIRGRLSFVLLNIVGMMFRKDVYEIGRRVQSNNWTIDCTEQLIKSQIETFYDKLRCTTSG